MLHNMTEGRPLSLILPFMVPLLIGNIFQQLYNIADIIIVGRTIGVEALAAVGSVSPLFMFGVMLTIGSCNGYTVVTGQRYGAGDMAGMRRSIATCLFLACSGVVLIMALMHLLIDPVLVLMNIPAALVPDARSYVMIIVDGITAMMAYNLLSAIMRSLGDSRTPLYFLIIATLVNIALALFFIIYCGWGVPGSAVAMVIAQAFSAFLCLWYIYRRFPQLHIGRQDFRLDWPELWAHLRMGLPMAVQFSLIGLAVLILQSVCNSFGTAAIAGFTAAVRMEQIAFQPLISCGISMAVFTAQNYGARRFDRIREAVRRCSFLAGGFSLLSALLIFSFGNQIIAIFLDNPEAPVVEAAKLYIFHTVPCYIFLSQIFIYRNSCQGMGISLIPMLASSIEFVMRSGAALVLSQYLGFRGICMASPIAWVSNSLFCFAAFHYFINLLERKHKGLP